MKLDTKLMANDLFDSLQPEQEQEIRKFTSEPNKSLEYLIKKYEEFIEEVTSYGKAEKLYNKLKFDNNYLTSKNIEEFSLVLGNYQKLENFYLSGYFISRVINDSKDKEFTIHTKHLDSLIGDIGYKNNGKTITVNGDAGYEVGRLMKSGNITVNGDAKHWIGYLMKNGSININGNAGDCAGWSMKNGNITINGNTGDSVGDLMENGIIHLNGDYQSLSDYIYGGNIYHKDKLIVKNGERI